MLNPTTQATIFTGCCTQPLATCLHQKQPVPSIVHQLAMPCCACLQSPSASAQQPHQGQQWPLLLSSQQQQQQPGLLQVGLRVCSAPHSPGLQSKVLAAAGLSRPGTSFIAPPSSPARCSTRGSSRSGSRPKSRSPSRSPPRFRPSTAPVPSSPTAAVAAADEAAASSMYRVWVPELQAAAANSGLCSSRDVVLRFVAEEGRSYVVLPYTR